MQVFTPPQADYPIFVVAEKNEDHTLYDLVQSLSCEESFSSVRPPALGEVRSMSEEFGEFVFL